MIVSILIICLILPLCVWEYIQLFTKAKRRIIDRKTVYKGGAEYMCTKCRYKAAIAPFEYSYCPRCGRRITCFHKEVQ